MEHTSRANLLLLMLSDEHDVANVIDHSDILWGGQIVQVSSDYIMTKKRRVEVFIALGKTMKI